MTTKEKWLIDINRLQNCLTNLEDALQYDEYVNKLDSNTDFAIISMNKIKMLGMSLDNAFNKKLSKPK
jgi:GTP-sensing pleiotropic transcriptional regulator CodY